MTPMQTAEHAGRREDQRAWFEVQTKMVIAAGLLSHLCEQGWLKARGQGAVFQSQRLDSGLARKKRAERSSGLCVREGVRGVRGETDVMGEKGDRVQGLVASQGSTKLTNQPTNQVPSGDAPPN